MYLMGKLADTSKRLMSIGGFKQPWICRCRERRSAFPTDSGYSRDMTLSLLPKNGIQSAKISVLQCGILLVLIVGAEDFANMLFY